MSALPSATPAQVLTDMRGYARFYEKRDKYLCGVCEDAAQMLADMLAGQKIDGRRWGPLHRRLLEFEGSRGYPIQMNIARARLTMEALRRGETT
jgi:hypothetical protein